MKNKNLNKRTKIDKTNFNFKMSNLTENVLKKMKNENIIKNYFLENNFCLINGECIETMKYFISKGILVDHIITDIPYGTVQGLSIEGWKKKSNIPKWDIVIDNNEMFDCTFKISKPNSNLLLFSQEPLTNQLITSMNNYEKYSLSNKLIWVKNNHANGFNSKTTPLNYYEEILLIRKSLDESNSIELRKYFRKILENIPDSKKEIINKLGQGLDHCFRYENRTFYIPTKINYEKLIKKYSINKLDFFLEHKIIKKMWESENKTIFNIPKGSKIVKNVLEFKKDNKNIHPTQKPQDLLKHLIRIFTNKNDLILDFTCGASSTGIAALTEKRKFLGIELDSFFFKKSIEWYKKTINN